MCLMVMIMLLNQFVLKRIFCCYIEDDNDNDDDNNITV